MSLTLSHSNRLHIVGLQYGVKVSAVIFMEMVPVSSVYGILA